MNARRSVVAVAALGVAAGMAIMVAPGAGADPGTAPAGAAGSKRVRILDDCDPATFNAAFGAGTCQGGGRTTVNDFFGQFATTGAVKGWAFKPDDVHVHAGRDLHVVNQGGEFHTFSEVADFGGGCIPVLNAPGQAMVPECAARAADGTPLVFATTGVGSGGTRHVPGLSPGTHKFECLIHPWMRSVVEVRADEDGGHHLG